MSGKRQRRGRGRGAETKPTDDAAVSGAAPTVETNTEVESPCVPLTEPESVTESVTATGSGSGSEPATVTAVVSEPEPESVTESEPATVTAVVSEPEPESVTESEPAIGSGSESATVTAFVTESEPVTVTAVVTESERGSEPETGDEHAHAWGGEGAEEDLDTDFPFGSNMASSVGTVSADDEELELAPTSRPGLEKAPPLPTGEAHLKGVIESLLFVSDKPLPASRLAKIARASTREVQRLLDVLVGEYQGRGIELVEVAGGYQFRSSAENAPFVRELVARKPVRLTRAQIETLSILAYRQPITRPEIDEIRGVDSGSALKVLLDKNLVRIIGRKEEPGRPLLYGTTAYFLEFFGLPSLSELPTLREYSELSDESRALFQRRTGEAIDTIGDIDVESRHYSDDEVEAAEAQAARRLHGDDEATEADGGEAGAQGELSLEGEAPDQAADETSGEPEEELEDELDEEDDDEEDEEDE